MLGVKLLLLLLDGIVYHPNTFTNKSKIYLFQSFLQKEFSFIRTVVGGRCLKKERTRKSLCQFLITLNIIIKNLLTTNKHLYAPLTDDTHKLMENINSYKI